MPVVMKRMMPVVKTGLMTSSQGVDEASSLSVLPSKTIVRYRQRVGESASIARGDVAGV